MERTSAAPPLPPTPLPLHPRFDCKVNSLIFKEIRTELRPRDVSDDSSCKRKTEIANLSFLFLRVVSPPPPPPPPLLPPRH